MSAAHPELRIRTAREKTRAEFPITLSQVRRIHGVRARYAPPPDYKSADGRFRTMPDCASLEISALIRPGLHWNDLQIVPEHRAKPSQTIITGTRAALESIVREFIQVAASLRENQRAAWLRARSLGKTP